MKFWIAQAISLLGCILFIVSIKQKTQKRISIVQTIECVMTGTAGLFTGAIIGSLTTYISGMRNFLSIWNKNHKWISIVMVIAVSIITACNWTSVWDLFPLLATTTYTILMSFHSAKITKIAVIPNCLLWLIYDFHYGLYVYCAFNIINVGFCIYDLAKKKFED